MTMIPVVRSVTPKLKKVELPEGFVPGPHHVICGRGKQSFHLPGNRRFRLAIAVSMHTYQRAKTRFDKTLVVISIVDSFREAGGGFVKRNYKKQGEHWLEIGDRLAREKVGHAVRDALNSKEREFSSLKRFSQVMTLSDLMGMSPSELEHTEMELKLGSFDKKTEPETPLSLALSGTSSSSEESTKNKEESARQPVRRRSRRLSYNSIVVSRRSSKNFEESKLPIVPISVTSLSEVELKDDDLDPIDHMDEIDCAEAEIMAKFFSIQRDVSLCDMFSRGSFNLSNRSSNPAADQQKQQHEQELHSTICCEDIFRMDDSMNHQVDADVSALVMSALLESSDLEPVPL